MYQLHYMVNSWCLIRFSSCVYFGICFCDSSNVTGWFSYLCGDNKLLSHKSLRRNHLAQSISVSKYYFRTLLHTLLEYSIFLLYRSHNQAKTIKESLNLLQRGPKMLMNIIEGGKEKIV